MANTLVPAVRRLGALLALGLIALAWAPARAASAETVVSLTFDDGTASQYDVARPELLSHGMRGTFFINSGKVGESSYFMTWAELDQINADGDEIAGHTVNDLNLNTLSADDARAAICDDAATLRSRGYSIVDFAYPHGAGYTNPAVRAALLECGYVSARTYGGLRDEWDCTSCPYVETLPPQEAFRIRTGGWKATPYTLENLKTWVNQALQNGGGWVPLVFHDFGHGGQDGSVTPEDFKAFLDWLQGSGAAVRTVRAVMFHPDLPPPAEPPLPVRAFGAPAPDRVTALASLKARKKQDVDKIHVAAAMLEPGTVSAGGTVSVPGGVRTLTSRAFTLKGASATAVPGKRVKLRLKLGKKALRAAKRAIRRHRRVRAKITITATDKSGNRKRAKRTVRLVD